MKKELCVKLIIYKDNTSRNLLTIRWKCISALKTQVMRWFEVWVSFFQTT
jgi:hypothetical protein